MIEIGDRVRMRHPRHGMLVGTVRLVNSTHLTAMLDYPKKKAYPTDREEEHTDFIRRWEKIDD